ncbi:MAG TPA: hypothetical protein VFA25_04895 [Actinomycetota bacterium]|nr:hypothetical protein [Actinomycetota bacterium]
MRGIVAAAGDLPREPTQPFDGAAWTPFEIGHQLLDLGRLVVDQGEEEILLPFEIDVEGALAHPGLGAYIVDCQRLEPAVTHSAQRGGYQVMTTGFLRGRLESWHGRSPDVNRLVSLHDTISSRARWGRPRMRKADVLVEAALRAADQRTETDEAVRELIGTGASDRTILFDARSKLVETYAASAPADPTATKAFELLTEALRRCERRRHEML